VQVPANTVFDLDVRRRIVEFVRSHPGLNLQALAEALKMPASTLTYHCRILGRHGQMALRESGRSRAFYPTQGMDRRDRDLLYMIRHHAPRRICAHLLLHPGSTPGDLKQALAVSGPALSFHLNKLRAANVLFEEPDGRTKRLYVGDAARLGSVLATYSRSFLDRSPA
jgi:predicted transcriptional regulator